VVVVELQPSSWSKGSYLNVGTMFLLAPPQPGAPRLISFDAGQFRVLPFHPITTPAQCEEAEDKFESAIIAAVAEEETRFDCAQSAAAELTVQNTMSMHDQYYRMMLLALAGQRIKAAQVADTILKASAPTDWMLRVQENTRSAVELLEDQEGFQRLVISIIQNRRNELGLAKIADTDLRTWLSARSA
jgi:hypothetical protein